MPCSDVLSIVDQTPLQGESSLNQIKNNSPTISSRKVQKPILKNEKKVFTNTGILGKATIFFFADMMKAKPIGWLKVLRMDLVCIFWVKSLKGINKHNYQQSKIQTLLILN